MYKKNHKKNFTFHFTAAFSFILTLLCEINSSMDIGGNFFNKCNFKAFTQIFGRVFFSFHDLLARRFQT